MPEMTDIEFAWFQKHYPGKVLPAHATTLPSPGLGSVGSHHPNAFDWLHQETLAKRNPVGVRYDILYAAFEEVLAKIGHYGAEHYGDFNWQKSRLTGDKSPVNHISKHLNSYKQGRPYDHHEIGTSRKYHLAAIAFNAMMEYWYEENLPHGVDRDQAQASKQEAVNSSGGGLAGSGHPLNHREEA